MMTRFEELLDEIRELHNKKAADYGNDRELGNFMEAQKMGLEPWRGCLVRMSDKIARLYSFAKKGVLLNESVRDTAIDLAVYSLLFVILHEVDMLVSTQQKEVRDGDKTTDGQGDGLPEEDPGAET